MRTLMMATAGAILALLAGCAKPLEVSSITDIKPQTGSAGLDVYAARRAQGEKVPELAGDQIVEVRTFAEGDGTASEEEFAGAACKLSARDFSAELTSPAKVRVPNYREQSSTLAVSCQKEGFSPKMQEAAVFNKTKSERLSIGSNGGLVGVALALAVNEMSDTSNDEFKYPVVRVVMARKGAGPVKTADKTGIPPH